MRKLILLCASFFAVFLAFSVAPAQAAFVLWVSATGSDANSCFEEAPCKTFQGAINKGNVIQVNCLTSGDYGGFNITASITIDCGTGNVGNVAVSGNDGITISTNASATIVLRHLHVNGTGSAIGIGIDATMAGGSLTIEDCMIHGFSGGAGMQLTHVGGGARSLLQMSNTQVFNNNEGLLVDPTQNKIMSVTLNQVELTGNTNSGLRIVGTGVVAGTMHNSLVSSNGTFGITASASQTFFSIEGSNIAANLTAGIDSASAGTVLNVGTSTLGGNGTAVQAESGSIVSFGNNQFAANGVDGNFTSTKALK